MSSKMPRRTTWLFLAVVAALVAIFTARQKATVKSPKPPLVPGRNNTVLFITSIAPGLSNVHVATTYALLERHPELDVHYASFPALEKDMAQISDHARSKDPAARSLTWHELPGTDFVDAAMRSWGNVDGVVGKPGLPGISKMVADMELSMSPWEVEEHWMVYQAVCELIQEVDPALLVLDSMMHPAMEAARNLRRRHAVISPTGLADLLLGMQPHGGVFWKFPALGSGHEFPVPWKKIPSNIYLILRLIYTVVMSPSVKAKRALLEAKGIEEPLDFFEVGHLDVPWLLASFPEGGIPVDYIPPHITCCGPIVRDVATVQDQDKRLYKWLKRGNTMLVNLGSQVKYNERRAVAMAEALATVLEKTDAQVLWKFRKLHEYDDGLLEPLKKYVDNGRLRIESWLSVDPFSLLKSGQISVSVHHGGANCYHESLLAGTPQVILPLWADLYNYAQMAEYLGVGIWPGKDTAPDWDPATLSEGFLQAWDGETGAAMRSKAEELGVVARSYGGRDTAAAELARLAAGGI